MADVELYYILHEASGKFLHRSTRSWTYDRKVAFTLKEKDSVNLFFTLIVGERFITHDEALVIATMHS